MISYISRQTSQTQTSVITGQQIHDQKRSIIYWPCQLRSDGRCQGALLLFVNYVAFAALFEWTAPSLVISRLDYGNALLSRLPVYQCRCLQKVGSQCVSSTDPWTVSIESYLSLPCFVPLAVHWESTTNCQFWPSMPYMVWSHRN